ncbi:30416_t:CDS:2, partial [Racocetra persica]
ERTQERELVSEDRTVVLMEAPLAVVIQINTMMKGLLKLLIETKPFSNNLSDKNGKIDICKMDNNAMKENVKGNATINKSEKGGMFKVKHNEYIPMSSNKTALDYNDKTYSSKYLSTSSQVLKTCLTKGGDTLFCEEKKQV